MRIFIAYLAAFLLAFAPLEAAAKKKQAAKPPSSAAKSRSPRVKKISASSKSSKASKVSSKARKSSKSARASKSRHSSQKHTTARRGQQQPTSDRYREIQQVLADKGYYKGEVNGSWGPDSVDALKRFQSDQNLKDDGKITSLSLIGLGLGPKHTNSITPVVPPSQNPTASTPSVQLPQTSASSPQPEPE